MDAVGGPSSDSEIINSAKTASEQMQPLKERIFGEEKNTP
jgi:hypothetical protein